MSNNSEIFTLVPPEAKTRPVIISSPHSGINIPDEIAELMTPLAKKSLDSDHHIDELYKFAPSLGFYFIHANMSRYVIDLNRSPNSAPLYSDGRQETTLVPTKSFTGENLYIDNAPNPAEIEDRTKKYYLPYHGELEKLIRSLKKEFGAVLLFDAHSIKRNVPTIQSEPFPDMILGNQDGKTASSELFTTALSGLNSGFFEASSNHPFKGGHITRSFGDLENDVHALQLEMSQDVYMDESTNNRDLQKEAIVSAILNSTLDSLGNKIGNL
jgi:N-formylglutamate deformylase